MSDDLVKRLRGAECAATCGSMKVCVCAYALDAADRIEALEAALTIDPWVMGYTGWKMHVDETLAGRKATGEGEKHG